MDTTIDKAVNDYLSQLVQSQDEFIRDIEELQDEGLNAEEILVILATFSIADYWLQDLLMQRAVDSYMSATVSLLDEMKKYGSISEAQLRAYQRIQEASVVNYTRRLGEEIRIGLTQGISRNLKGTKLREKVTSKVSLNAGRIENVIATNLATYNRSVVMAMSTTLENDVKFYYHGPLDEKTRPICRVMLSTGGLTRNEVMDRFPGALDDGGGINCRHNWLPEQSDKKITKQALAEVSQNPKKFNKAKTLLEYARDRDRK